MSPLSCQDVLEHIELHAAGETDPALAADLDRHLSTCPSCRRAHEEALELVALLDWEHRADAGLARLEERLLDRPGVLPFRRPQRPAWRRLAAVAALLLALLGLGVWLPTADPDGSTPVEVALLSGRDILQERGAPAKAVALARGAEVVKHRLRTGGATPSAYRSQLREQAALGKTPAALRVDLALALSNDGPRPLLLDLAHPATTLRLELHGPGVLRVPATGGARTLADLGRLRLRSGGHEFVPLDRLADSSAHWYWTEPGRYRLTARIRTRVAEPGGPWRWQTFSTAPIVIDVTAN